YLAADQIGRKRRQSIILAFRKVEFDRHVAAFHVAGLTQATAKRVDKVASVILSQAAQEANHRHRRLLRARREWPRGRAAEQRDELATFQCSVPPVLPTKIAHPSALRVRLGQCEPLRLVAPAVAGTGPPVRVSVSPARPSPRLRGPGRGIVARSPPRLSGGSRPPARRGSCLASACHRRPRSCLPVC